MKKLLGLGLALSLAGPASAFACAALGANGPVVMHGEEALIVWDAARGMEHFVRRAFFDGAPASFGFLVPTPTRPELAEVTGQVFTRLFEQYRMPPDRALRARPIDSNGPIAAAAVAPVQVIEQKTVAGMDASVLLASDGKALSDWLARNKYPSSPAIQAWLAPYIARGAYVTAFRVTADRGRAEAGSVRMSFKTAAPYFPYSEPAQRERSSRPFRLSVIAPEKFSAQLGGKRWGASVAYASPIERERMDALLEGVVPKDAVANSRWLTVFDEPASVRGVEDLTLSPAKDARKDARKFAPTLRSPIAP